jgi:hypothetical protein
MVVVGAQFIQECPIPVIQRTRRKSLLGQVCYAATCSIYVQQPQHRLFLRKQIKETYGFYE